MVYHKFCECENILTAEEMKIGYCNRCHIEKEQKWRSSKVCFTCSIHTVQKLTQKGWVCKECSTLVKEVEAKWLV